MLYRWCGVRSSRIGADGIPFQTDRHHRQRSATRNPSHLSASLRGQLMPAVQGNLNLIITHAIAVAIVRQAKIYTCNVRFNDGLVGNK